jgi:hypothetical protein
MRVIRIRRISNISLVSLKEKESSSHCSSSMDLILSIVLMSRRLIDS